MNLTRRHSTAFIVGSRARNFARKNVCSMGAYFSIASVDVVSVGRELMRCALPTSSGAWRLPSVRAPGAADGTGSAEAHEDAYEDEGGVGRGASADVQRTADGVPMSALRRYTYGFDAPLAEALSLLMRGASVGDFGSGDGQYCTYWEKRNEISSALCFDGASDIAARTNGLVRSVDFARPVELGVRFDWVLAINVLEYVPAALQPTLLNNMHRHTRSRHSGGAEMGGAEGRGAGGDASARGGGIILVVGKPGTALTPPLGAAAHGAPHAIDEVRGVMRALGYRSDAASEALLIAAAPHLEGCVLVLRRAMPGDDWDEWVRALRRNVAGPANAEDEAEIRTVDAEADADKAPRLLHVAAP